MRRKKSMIMALCALLVIFSVAFGTIAYLTDRESVTNTFTVGNVDIIVDEEFVGSDGKDPNPEESNRTEDGNSYPLVPGSEYDKDPTLTVKKGSEKAYVRMIVTLTKAEEIDTIFQQLKKDYAETYKDFGFGNLVDGYDGTKWVHFETKKNDDNTYTLEFRYYQIVDASEADMKLEPLFTKIRIPGELNNLQLNSLKDFTIDVYGQAIQTTGFDTAEEAWAAFDKQMGVTDGTNEGTSNENTSNENTSNENTSNENTSNENNPANDETTKTDAGEGNENP